MPRRRAPRNLESLDQLFRTEDLRATEPIPPRTDKQEIVFQSSAGAIDCRGDGHSVRLRVTGDLLRVRPVAEESHRLAIDELHRVGEQVRLPRAHRPPWLDALTVPRIRPRPFVRGGPVPARTLSLELCLSGYPWCAIGKLFINRVSGEPKMGSGVLVGPNLLLTASHAMPWGTSDSTIRFVPNDHARAV